MLYICKCVSRQTDLVNWWSYWCFHFRLFLGPVVQSVSSCIYHFQRFDLFNVSYQYILFEYWPNDQLRAHWNPYFRHRDQLQPLCVCHASTDHPSCDIEAWFKQWNGMNSHFYLMEWYKLSQWYHNEHPNHCHINYKHFILSTYF